MNMPGSVKTELINSAKSLGVDVHEIGEKESETLIATTCATYINSDVLKKAEARGYPFLWKAFRNPLVAVRNASSWQWAAGYVKNMDDVLFISETSNDRNVFIFKRGQDILPTLEASFGIDFYLTNAKAEYLLCYQRDDYLVALGKAADWLTGYLKDKDISPDEF